MSIFRPSFEWTICCFSARRKKHNSWLACWWWWCHASQMGPVDPHTLVPNWATKEWRLMLYGSHSILKSKKVGNPSIPIVNINFLLMYQLPINYTYLFNQVSVNHLPVYKYGIGMYYKNDYNSTMHMGRLRPIVHYKNTFKKSSSPFSLGGWHALWCGLLQHTEYVCKKLIYDILDIFK